MAGKQTEDVWVQMTDGLKNFKGNCLEDSSVKSPGLLLLGQKWINIGKEVRLYFNTGKLQNFEGIS